MFCGIRETGCFRYGNCGIMDDVRDTAIYVKCETMANLGYDVIVGYITNDKMYSVLERFFNRNVLGSITDVQLIQCLSVLKLGTQYVAKIQKAYDRIKIVNERELPVKERQELATMSVRMRKQGIELATDIVRQNRRAGGR